TQSTRLDATGRDGIWVSETGDLEVGSVASHGTSVNLTATGSIIDVDSSVAINVDGATLNLTAGTGSIGTTGDALRIDAGAAAGSLNASAGTGINLYDAVGGVGIGQVTSTGGNIKIVTKDTSATGEDIVLSALSTINAQGGDVTLDAGDNVIVAAKTTASIVA